MNESSGTPGMYAYTIFEIERSDPHINIITQN